MPFCTQCGYKVKPGHRFCFKCGTKVASEVKPAEQKQEQKIKVESKISESKKIEPKKTIETYSIDRKTLFDDGMLVLTSFDLILYSSDEKDELKRIPLSIIEDCSYSMLKRGFVVKKRVNEEENLANYLEQLENAIEDFDKTLEDLEEEIEQDYSDIKQLEKECRRAEYKEDAEEIEYKINQIEDEIEDKENKIENIEKDKKEKKEELSDLQTDRKKTSKKQQDLADIDKEVFKLPKNFTGTHSVKDEYKIWEFVIKRRIVGPSMLKIVTTPYDAVVRINEKVVGTTPISIELPVIDNAVLAGRYEMEIIKEGFDVKAFSVNTDLGKRFLEEIELKEPKELDQQIEKEIKELRKEVPDRSIDLSTYNVLKEFICQSEVFLITTNSILGLSKDKKQFLYEIPFGIVKDAKYNKGFFGDKSIEVIFNEKDFGEQTIKTWIDNKGDKISEAEVKQYSESFVEYVKRKMKESKVIVVPRYTHAKEFYTVSKHDLRDNFKRFNPEDFEHLIAKLFMAKGYKAEVTQYQGDFGVDVIAESGSQKAVIQVKHWKNNVGSPDVQKTLGSMFKYGANQAIVITSSDFTNQAYEVADGNTPLELWNGEKVQEEISQYLLTSN